MINRRWVSYGPPNFPFTINRESSQVKGLVGWWPPIASWGGSLLRDLGGSSFDGVFTGSPAWVQNGIVGAGLDYVIADGDYILLPSLTGQVFTIAVWGILNSTSLDDWRYLWGRDAAIAFGISKTGAPFNADFGTWLSDGTFTWYNSGFTPTLGTLYHFVVTRDAGNTLRFYVDGNEKTPSISTRVPSSNANPDSIGLFIPSDTIENWDGYIGDVRLYNRALSAIEVKQLYVPKTRWELYQPMQRALVFVAAAISSAYPGRNHPSKNLSLRM